MNERLQSVLVALTLVVLGIGWWVGYVAPKAATLDAAAACVHDKGHAVGSQESRLVWDGCLDEAEKAHATSLLLAVGY